jgi:hypothetical protein
MRPPLLARVVRRAFRHERIPTRLRWWFAAEGMCDWYDVLARDLAPHLGGLAAARRVLADASAPMLLRRYAILRDDFGLPDDRASRGLVFGALYRIASRPSSEWIFDAVGPMPRTFLDHLRAERLVRPIAVERRWEELTCHLGELLVALTEHLPSVMPRARGVLGEICWQAGLRFGRKMKHAFALNDHSAGALELLRMGEYIFRVNPEHWGEAHERTGWIEGTACPWVDAPGWNGAHCGIFGQFQSGISAVFGLRYHLTTTIPKNGGRTCRIDVKPIALRRSAGGDSIATERSS